MDPNSNWLFIGNMTYTILSSKCNHNHDGYNWIFSIFISLRCTFTSFRNTRFNVRENNTLFSVYPRFFLAEFCFPYCRFLPYVGWITIIMTEKPIVKVCLLKSSIHTHWDFSCFIFISGKLLASHLNEEPNLPGLQEHIFLNIFFKI